MCWLVIDVVNAVHVPCSTLCKHEASHGAAGVSVIKPHHQYARLRLLQPRLSTSRLSNLVSVSMVDYLSVEGLFSWVDEGFRFQVSGVRLWSFGFFIGCWGDMQG